MESDLFDVIHIKNHEEEMRPFIAKGTLLEGIEEEEKKELRNGIYVIRTLEPDTSCFPPSQQLQSK